jgi:hypothetical protein
MTEETYKVWLKDQIIKKIDDLKSKIENNEPFPHGEQDKDSLVEIEDNLQGILNNWYY